MSDFAFKYCNNHNIKNIVFDLGGVVLDIDYRLTLDAYRSLGVKDLEKIYTLKDQTELFNKLDCGTITVPDFIAELRKLIALPLTDAQIVWAWNALLLPWNMDRMRLLEQLASTYNVYLLSNTNKIHFDVYNRQLVELTGGKLLVDYFSKAYFSFDMGMRKPNLEIFELVLADSHLKAEETLFIDDSPKNTEAASKLGIVAYNLNPSTENILQLFTAN